MGEFGRMLKINKNVSCDYWLKCYIVLFVGGGVK